MGDIIRDNISYSVSIPIIKPELIGLLYEKYIHYNFDSIKLVLSDDLDENINRAGLVRKLFGNEIQVRLDANGKLSFEESVANLANLKKYNISAIEQPLPVGSIKDLKKFRKNRRNPRNSR